MGGFTVLNKYQFGFRKGHSTILAVAEIVDNIRNHIDSGISVVGIYIDLSKAFDCENHEILLNKMNHYGIQGQALKRFKSYLTSRKQIVYVNGVQSKPRTITVGVPQGSVLGPLLFLLYINDIDKCDKNALFRLFADDTNIFVYDKDTNALKTKAESSL